MGLGLLCQSADSLSRRIPFTLAGHGCRGVAPAAVSGQHRNPSHVALQNPEMMERDTLICFISMSFNLHFDRGKGIEGISIMEVGRVISPEKHG